MKLRTEMVPRSHDTGMSPKATFGHPVQALYHDAMAAHALLQAMGEFHPSNEAARASFDLAKKRAAEILAGWLREDGG